MTVNHDVVGSSPTAGVLLSILSRAFFVGGLSNQVQPFIKISSYCVKAERVRSAFLIFKNMYDFNSVMFFRSL